MAATNIRDFMFRPSASVRRSSDALRQRDGRSAAQPYKAEKQGIGRRAFRAGSQSRIAMLYFFRLKIPNCVGQLGILVAQFLKLLIIVPVDLGFDRGCAGPCRFGTNRSEEHTSALQSLMRISYAVSCLNTTRHNSSTDQNHLSSNS